MQASWRATHGCWAGVGPQLTSEDARVSLQAVLRVQLSHRSKPTCPQETDRLLRFIEKTCTKPLKSTSGKIGSTFSKSGFFMKIPKPKPESTFVHPLGDYIIIKPEVEKSIGLSGNNVVPGPRFLTGERCVAVPVCNGCQHASQYLQTDLEHLIFPKLL